MPKTSRELSDDERALWQFVTRDVKPYRARAAPRPRRPEEDRPTKVRTDAAPAPARRSPPPLKLGEVAGIDRRTAQRFRRGDLPIESRLDLHGLTLAEAEAALNRFIVASAAAGRRCLLVVTGKGDPAAGSMGKPSRGGIRREAPHWLGQPRLRPLILAVMPAQPRHGGNGALYVLLKRRLNDT